jgi:hypothetical protein
MSRNSSGAATGRAASVAMRAGLLAAGLALLAPAAATATPVSILFIGNSYTFGNVGAAPEYNRAGVRDLTAPTRPGFENQAGANVYQTRPWGGVPGIFKTLTEQAGLDFDVAHSTRNAATLRGHYLNLNPAGWDLRGNLASQRWDHVVLQEQSALPLPLGTTDGSRPAVFNTYAALLAEYARTQSADRSFRERELFGGTATACAAITGNSTGTCNTVRNVPGNPNTNPNTQVHLQQTWARPNLIAGGFETVTDETTGVVTRTATPITGPYPAADGVERMTADLRAAYAALLAARPDLFASVAPVGDAFLLAILEGLATRNMFAPDAQTDGLIDLWHDDGTHASKWGSYLSALTLFGTITGLDPQSLGSREEAARELGISRDEAEALQLVAALTLGFAPVPGPAAAPLFLLGLVALGAMRRRGARARS